MARLMLSTLGAVRLACLNPGAGVDGSAQDVEIAPLLLALLVYLALQPGRAASRTDIVTTFWPDADEMQGRANLRQAMLRLRRFAQRIGISLFEETPSSVRLAGDALHCDAADLLGLAGSDNVDDAQAIAGLYGGTFLRGFSLERGDFDAWRAGVAADLDRHAAAALERLVRAELAGVPGPQTVALAEKLHRINSFREDVQRLLLEAIWRREGRHAALRRFEELSTMMQAELGCALEPETTALAERIEASGVPAAGSLKVPRSATAGPSIAVMPFVALGSDPDAQVLALGLGEDLAAALSRIRGLSVIASSSTYAVRRKDAVSAGQALGAVYMVEGSAAAVGGRFRVRARLVDTASGGAVWSHSFDVPRDDILSLQDEIAARVAGALEPGLYAREAERARAAPSATLDSWGRTMRAIVLIGRFDEGSNLEAQTLLKEAIRVSPDYAKAHAVLGWAIYWKQHAWLPGDQTPMLKAAISAANNALRLDPDEPWGHMTRGFAASAQGDHAGAIEMLRTALRLSPSFALARLLLGWVRVRHGEQDKAVDDCRRALELSPLDNCLAVFKCGLGLALLASRRFDEAAAVFREGLSLSPEFLDNLNLLVACCGHLDLAEEAARLLAFRRKYLGWEWKVEGASARSRRFAHHDVFVDGLRKAGVPEK